MKTVPAFASVTKSARDLIGDFTLADSDSGADTGSEIAARADAV